MAHPDAFFPRSFNVDMFPFEMDLKSGLLADVQMPLAMCEPVADLQSSSRMEEFFGAPIHRASFDDESSRWAPEDLEVPSSADSSATAPSNPFPSTIIHSSPIMRAPAYTPSAMMRHMALGHDGGGNYGSHMGPVAAPISTFPSIDMQTFRRPRQEMLEPEESTASLPAHEQSIESMDSSSPGVTARAVRAASRNKRVGSPSDDLEYEVPSTSPVRGGPDTRRKKPIERQASRHSVAVDSQLSEEERLEKNRQSARDCRLRKKRYIESLERRLAEADKRETVLTQTIERLQEQVAALSRKH